MNFKKLKSIICVIATLFCLSSPALTLQWNPSPSTNDPDPTMNVSGYRVYYGTATHSYNVLLDAGSNTNLVIANSNFATNVTYYFSVTATNEVAESDFSAEAVWTNSVGAPDIITFVGVQVNYGLTFASLNSQRVMVMSVTNHPNYFYNESLVLTNNPFVGVKPNDGNNYLYIGTTMQYGSNLTSLTTATFPLLTFTNPPAYFYGSSLILTNNPF